MNSQEEKIIFVVAPHPDDEVIGCGGTVIKKIAEGYRVKLIFTTDGSRSHAAVLHIYSDPTPEELARIRRSEAMNAAAVLGVQEDDVHFLDAEDTRLHLAVSTVRAGMLQIFSINPGAREIYLPHEKRELNSDHRLTGQLVLDCLNTLGMKPRIFKYVVWDENTERAFGFVNRGSFEVSESVEEEQFVDIRDHLQQKLAALSEHKTQTTLFCSAQVRTVVPPEFKRRIEEQECERFFVHASTIQQEAP